MMERAAMRPSQSLCLQCIGQTRDGTTTRDPPKYDNLVSRLATWTCLCKIEIEEVREYVSCFCTIKRFVAVSIGKLTGSSSAME
jgi:hypothetical protein